MTRVTDAMLLSKISITVLILFRDKEMTPLNRPAPQPPTLIPAFIYLQNV